MENNSFTEIIIPLEYIASLSKEQKHLYWYYLQFKKYQQDNGKVLLSDLSFRTPKQIKNILNRGNNLFWNYTKGNSYLILRATKTINKAFELSNKGKVTLISRITLDYIKCNYSEITTIKDFSKLLISAIAEQKNKGRYDKKTGCHIVKKGGKEVLRQKNKSINKIARHSGFSNAYISKSLKGHKGKTEHRKPLIFTDKKTPIIATYSELKEIQRQGTTNGYAEAYEQHFPIIRKSSQGYYFEYREPNTYKKTLDTLHYKKTKGVQSSLGIKGKCIESIITNLNILSL